MKKDKTASVVAWGVIPPIIFWAFVVLLQMDAPGGGEQIGPYGVAALGLMGCVLGWFCGSLRSMMR